MLRHIDGFVDVLSNEADHARSLNAIIMGLKDLTSLLPLVEALGPYLTHQDELVRSRGTLLLSQVLSRVTSMPLSAAEVAHLVRFYSDRLHDVACGPEVVQGMHALVFHHDMPADSAGLLCESVLGNVGIQAMPQKARYQMLQIINHCMTVHMPSVIKLQREAVRGLINAVDGERDPRNLLLTFQAHVKLSMKLDQLGSEVLVDDELTEDLFDVVACYYPITFSPPPNDPYHIKPGDLRRALSKCMCASPKFASPCITLLLSKIAEDSHKVETLQLLALSLRTYRALAVCKHADGLRDALLIQMATAGQECVAAVCEVLYTPVAAGDPELVKAREVFVRDALDLVVQRQGQTAALVLGAPVSQPQTLEFMSALVTASHECCTDVLQSVGQFVLDRYTTLQAANTDTTKQTLMLDAVLRILQGVALWTKAASPGVELRAVELVRGLESSLVQVVGLAQASPLVAHRALAFRLQAHVAQADSLVQSCVDTILVEDSPSVRQACVDALVQVGRRAEGDDTNAPPAVLVAALARLRGALVSPPAVSHDCQGGQGQVREDVEDLDEQKRRIAMAVVALTSLPDTGAAAIEVLVDFTCYVLGADAHPLDPRVMAAWRTTAVTALQEAQAMADAQAKRQSAKAVVERMLGCLLDRGRAAPDRSISISDLLAAQVFGVLCLCVRQLNSSEHIEVFERLAANFVDEANAPLWGSDAIVAMACVVATLPAADVKTAGAAADALVGAAIQGDTKGWFDATQFRGRLACQMVASLFNKTRDDDAVQRAVAALTTVSCEPVDSSSTATMMDVEPAVGGASGSAACRRAPLLTAWIAKGLCVRGNRVGDQVVVKMCQGMGGDDEEEALCACLTVLFEDDVVLSKAMECTVKVLYKQRLYHAIRPLLVQTDGDKRVGRPLHVLLPCLPRTVVRTDMPKLFGPLVMESLSSDDYATVTAAYGLLAVALELCDEVVGPHVKAIVHMALKHSLPPASAECRLASTQCVEKLCALPQGAIEPFKKVVWKGLEPALNDPKRLIRKAAVDARNKWCTMWA